MTPGCNADQAWVQDGMKEGEDVVLYPEPTLGDGQAMKVLR
jgi:hypothetical protein